MTITIEAYTGSHTVSTTEWSLTTDTSGPDAEATAGIFQAFIDFNAVAAGDVFEVKAYERCRTGGTQRLVYSARIANAQGSPLWASPALALGIGWDFTLIKIAGTDRTIDWRISKIA
jgi:hypothetical protein